MNFKALATVPWAYCPGFNNFCLATYWWVHINQRISEYKFQKGCEMSLGGGREWSPYFTDEETEAQAEPVTWPHSRWASAVQLASWLLPSALERGRCGRRKWGCQALGDEPKAGPVCPQQRTSPCQQELGPWTCWPLCSQKGLCLNQWLRV